MPVSSISACYFANLMANKKLYFVVGGLTVVVVLLLVVLILGGDDSTGQDQKINLEFWGIFDDQKAFKAIIDAYEKRNRNIHITYRQFNNFEEYESAVLTAISEGKSPDIWMIHHTWINKHLNKLATLPQPTRTSESGYRFIDFQRDFVDVAVFDLVRGGQIYAFPLYVDTLALYYNKDILQSAGFTQPPATWEELIAAAQLLTRIDPDTRRIDQSAIALGTSRNINRSSDILNLLFLQSGVRMVNDDLTRATFAERINNLPVSERALEFYTSFANPLSNTYTFDDRQPYSIDAFANARTAMMLNYYHHRATIRAKTPRLNFALAPVPQFDISGQKINYANYFALSVLRAAPEENQREAWRFILFATSNEGQRLYLDATGRPTSRRDLIAEYKNDPELGIFSSQALTARSWSQVDAQAIEKIFADMIDEVNLHISTAQGALKTAQDKVNVLMLRR